jgi:aminopeptidase
MIDPRMTRLAQNLVQYSCAVEAGENVLIEATGVDTPMVTELVRQVVQAGGRPFVWLRSAAVNRAWQCGADDEQLHICAQADAALMRQMQCYIGLRGGDNASELSDVPPQKQELYNKLYWKRVHGEIRVPHTKWVVLRWPTPAFAQLAGMSTEAMEDFYFDVCCMDYAAMSRAMDALVDRMQRTDHVRIVARDTDISFRIAGMPAIKCDGQRNIPDGEIYTAPLRESVNGVITYNTPSIEGGFCYENVRLRFENGKIVEATANDTERINALLDTDAGARYIGEFAIGVNPFITKPMRDILFDEKISGSIHFTPGNAYEDADNGNRSAIHWDLVQIHTPEYGGGALYFDDELIRKDGRFIPESLHGLNPENLR